MPHAVRRLIRNLPVYLLVFIPALFYQGGAEHMTWAWLWYGKWFALLACLLVGVLVFLSRYYTWHVLLPAGYMLAQSIWYLAFRDTFYSGYEYRDILIVTKLACYNAAVITGLLLLFASLEKRHIARMSEAFGWVAVVNSLYVIYQFANGERGFNAGGLFGNASMNACLILAMAPLLNTRIKILHALPIAAVLIAGRTLPLVIASVLYPTWIYLRHKKYFPSVICLVLAVVAFKIAHFTPGLLDDKKTLFNDSGRFIIWKVGLTQFWNQYGWAGRLFGFGPGVSSIWLPQIQLDTHTSELYGWWIWWHNDYLQFSFDFGGLGWLTLTPALVTYWRSISRLRSWQISNAGLTALTLGLSALANYPLRIAPGALLFASMVLPTFRKRAAP